MLPTVDREVERVVDEDLERALIGPDDGIEFKLLVEIPGEVGIESALVIE